MSHPLTNKRRIRSVCLLALLCLFSLNLGFLRFGTIQGAASTPKPAAGSEQCIPGRGWNWVTGPAYPQTASRAAAALQRSGISAAVRAVGFGEEDSCGNFSLYSTDFDITLTGQANFTPSAQKVLANRIRPILSPLSIRRMGNLRITFAPGKMKVFQAPRDDLAGMRGSALPQTVQPEFNKRVLLLVYDPILSNQERLSAFLGLNSYADLIQEVIDSFPTVSNGRLAYSIAHTEVADEWPVQADGHRYTEAEYLQDYYNGTPYEPSEADYDAIIGDPVFDICGKLNRGEIDELWMVGAPYMGFAESRLVGPDAYWYNSAPMQATHGCTRLLPIMGFSYERGLAEALEDFGHRQEATMTRVYWGWTANSTATNWDRFTLVKAQAPNYSYSGCGGTHFAPNSVAAYDWDNHVPVLSNCQDFANYPALGNPLTVAQPLDCTAWGCTPTGYLMYWFGHLPANANCNTDARLSDWWQYFVNPDLATHPSSLCPPPPCPQITAWKGEYWTNMYLLGPASVCRNDSGLDFNWMGASPAPIIPADFFSVRWTRSVEFSPGGYTFFMDHDDGARLYIDGVLVLDRWSTTCETASVRVPIQAGHHAIRMEMFERDGWAGAHLWWVLETPPVFLPVVMH